MRSRKKSELRVYKLRSGEEIVARYAGKTKDKIKLQRPMRVVNAVQADPFTGSRRQVTYFTDWLGCTNSPNAEIPQDFVLVDFDPSPEITSLYSRQIELQDTGRDVPKLPLGDVEPKPVEVIPKSTVPFKLTEEEQRELQEEVDRLMREQEKSGSGESGPLSQSNPFIPPKSITFSIGVPQDIMEAWINNGFMDYLKDSIQDFLTGEFLDDIFEEMDEENEKKRRPKSTPPASRREKISRSEWKEPDEKQKSDPKFGNKPADWSPFIKDYVEDEKKKDEGLDKPE
jgi:hypothetical protein